jgi:toxin ParE1/3/4
VKVIWRKQAEDDLGEVFGYISEDDPQAAWRIYQTIRRQVEYLKEQPHLGRSGRVENTRELVVAGTPYIVAYTVDTRIGAVIILRVIHGRRQWPESL